MRYFSAVAGFVVIVLSWAIGRWLMHRASALVFALFVALTPMQVYYAREAKGYAFAAACALLSTYAWGRRLGYRSVETAPHSGKAHWRATYVLSTAAAIGTHYYLAPLLLWQGLWVLGQGATALIPGGQRGVRCSSGCGGGCWRQGPSPCFWRRGCWSFLVPQQKASRTDPNPMGSSLWGISSR